MPVSFLHQYKIQHCLQLSENEQDPNRKRAYQKKAVDHLLSALFEKCKPVPGKEEIVVTGYVMSDGKGDWFNMLNTCKHLQKKFPERTIRLIAISGEHHRGQLSAPKVKALDLIYSKDSAISAPIISPKDIPQGAELVEKVRNAAAVIIGPVNMQDLYSQLRDELNRTGIALHEYDANTNSDDLCGTKALMGLEKSFSIGIFTQAMKNQYSWNDIQNERLKGLLFGSSTPTEQAIDSYLQTHTTFLCYMGLMKALTFFQDAVSFANAQNPDQSVDICFPCKGSMEMLEQYLPLMQFEHMGFGSITMIYYEGTTQKETPFPLGDGKKILRIIDVGGLSPRDFRIVMKLSAPLVGCTGDNSLAQALSYGKIPFYEVAGHKSQLRHNLLSIVEEKLGDQSALYHYLKGNIEFKNRAPLLSNPELSAQAEQLGEWIRDHFSANSTIQGMINQRILIGKDPTFEEKIQQLQAGYLAGSLTIEQLEEHLIAELKIRGLL